MDEDEKHSGETLDKLLTGLDSVAKCLDSFGERMDAMHKRMDAFEGKSKTKDDEMNENELDEAGKPVHADDSDAAAKRSRDMVDTQCRADSVAQAFGESVPKPMQAEDVLAYRRRLLRPFQRHSKEFKDVDLYKIDGALLDGIETRIYADAAVAAERPDAWPDGRLREMKRTDQSGRVISTFHGNHSFVRQFKRPALHVRLNLASRSAS
jgi:hypothetical protein